MDALLELLSPERIQAIGISFTGFLTVWVSRQAAQVRQLRGEVTELKSGRIKDQGVIKASVKYIRALGVHNGVLTGLLRHHAPHVEIPAEPVMPEVLREEV
ncbi:hypothetical protein FFI94_022275 [Rhodococcus sp. KBS0724]|uniref:hypothetical protein n=1 Tax=Rhodococcus sp. KBS0724 TaxID=1179674 RepID=UPI00110E712E|nr:hypothetical protein [Rhodococcus sp. KBS0724]TSD48592.1 hypothetical protein FFI94_022275 [Rhodococcus sp. KBS0724]